MAPKSAWYYGQVGQRALSRSDLEVDDAACIDLPTAWWRHQMETFSALLAICAGNSPVPGEFLAQRPVARSFDVFFDLRLNKGLNKQSKGRCFETPSRSLWRHSNGLPQYCRIYVQLYSEYNPLMYLQFRLALIYLRYIKRYSVFAYLILTSISGHFGSQWENCASGMPNAVNVNKYVPISTYNKARSGVCIIIMDCSPEHDENVILVNVVFKCCISSSL